MILIRFTAFCALLLFATYSQSQEILSPVDDVKYGIFINRDRKGYSIYSINKNGIGA